jgi:CBS domain-containing protein
MTMGAPRVRDVMTRELIIARPTTPYKQLVSRMIANRISGLPVVDRAGRLLGVVSETDLLCRAEQGDDGPVPTRPGRFAGHTTRSRWYKATGLTANAVMTAPAVTVSADETLATVAQRFAETGLRRLCVTDTDGRLVGMLGRQDLLRPFLRCDQDIQHEVETQVLKRTLHATAAAARATVDNGVVLLTGRLEYQGDVTVASDLARHVPGVIAVHNRLDWQWNGHRAIDVPAQRARSGI